MLTYKPLYILLFLCLSTVFTMQAQQDIFELQTINIKDGLPNSSTYDILQDERHFIWTSTVGGLTRYDGYNFINYGASFFDIDESATLNIALDQNNLIWFSERLAFLESPQSGVFNPENEIITKFEDFSNGLFKSEDVLSLNPSTQIKNVIFITTKNGTIYKYDGSFKAVFKFSERRLYRVICDIDRFGNLWITYNDGDIIEANSNQKIISTYKIDIPSFIINKILTIKPFPIFEGYDINLKKDYWQIKNNVLERFKISPINNLQLLDISDSKMYYFQNDTIYQRNSNNTLNTKKEDIPAIALPNLQYNNAFIDKQNILWLTSTNGLHKIVVKKNPFTIYQLENSIRGLFVENNTLWIGGYKNNVTYNLKTRKELNIDFQKLTINSFTKDSNNNLWIGSVVNSLLKYNLSSKTWYSYKKSGIDALLLPYQNPVTKRIWIGKNNGLSYISAENKLTNYELFKGLIGAQIRQFLKTSEGIWIVSNKGLFLMDTEKEIIIKHYNTSNGFLSDNINHIYKDDDGIFWIATKGNGLIKWNYTRNAFKHFTRKEGLSNNTIYAVYEDDYKNLWLPSNYGLMRFDKTTNETQVFTVEDGIANNEFNTFAHYKDNEGALYFGSIRGLISFHPKDFIDKKSEENPIYLSGIKVLKTNNEEFETLKTIPTLENPILLNYDDQILELDVSLLDFKYVGNHQYAYKIEDYHKQWIYTRDNKISIFNFPYGQHTIRVKAKGDSDLWTSQELQVPISVNKPFYLKWQFLVFILFTAIFSTYFFFKLRLQNLNSAKIQLESEVKSRTQQIEKDKQLIELQSEELKALDVAKDRFFANLTHEFRTPLTLIIGPLEQIIDSPPPPAILKRRATGILNNSKHILGLINQLLDLSKLESNQMSLEFVNADIIKHTMQLVSRFEPLTLQNKQRLTFESNLSEWTINFDADKWDKIVFNLISNAVKFTPENGKISVYLNRYESDGKIHIEFIIKDTGIGIDAENEKLVFNRFHQADLSSTRANDGTGIGLALVRELVDLQKGNITLNSKVNEGTTFKILLPIPTDINIKPHIIKKQNNFLIPILSSNENIASLETENENKLDILVVDDNEDIRDYIVQCLGQRDYNISIAKNGDEGLEMALSLIPDLIISDVMMPKKNGFELLEGIRNHISTSHIPIILLTAKAEENSKIEGLMRGADAYLTKPFNPKELDIRVKNLIEIRQRLQNRYANNNRNTSDTTFEKEDAFILQLKTFVSANINQSDLNGDFIGQHFGLSRIHLYRKLKALTNISISEFVKNMRLEKGLELIEQRQLNVSEIAYEIGFTSPSHFSRSFKEKYGKSPSQM